MNNQELKTLETLLKKYRDEESIDQSEFDKRESLHFDVEFENIKTILDNQHWEFRDYKQRITTKQWKELLLDDNDSVIFRGQITKLKGKNLGYGVVEITKQT